MKKGLVLGAIAPFCDLIKEMEELQIYPVICDYYKDAPAKKMGYYAYDISTTDTEKMIQIARFHNVDGVISAFSDRNLNTAYILAKELNVPQLYSEKIIDLLTDKLLMKDFFQKLGLPVIKYRIIEKDFTEKELEGITFPVVTKPIDAYGSKGIFVCEKLEDIRKAFDKTTVEALRYKDRILVEEYYPVDEISITAWVKEGIPYITCIYDVIKNYKPSIILSAVSFPSKYTEPYLKEFEALLKYIISSCGIMEGPITLQCFIGPSGIKISELLFRLAGGSPYLYGTYIGGPNIAKMLIQFEVGEEIDYQNLEAFQPNIKDEVYFDIQIFIKEAGNIYYNFDVGEIKKKIAECVDLRIYHLSGDELINVGETGKIFARAICKVRGRNKQDYYNLIDKVQKIIKVYNHKGENIIFVRKPDNWELSEFSLINWDFIKDKKEV